MSNPIKSLVSEIKARTSPTSGCKNIGIRAYMFLCGQKNTFYQGFMIFGLAIFDTLRRFEGFMLLQQLVPITVYAMGMPHMFVFATSGKAASSILDEVIWVADLVERNASREEEQRNRTLARLSRLYFWVLFGMSSGACVVPAVIMRMVEGSTLMPTLLPDAEMIGESAASVAYWAMFIWQSLFCTLCTLAYSWVDGAYFGSILIIYGLTKMVSQSIRNVDFSKKEDMEDVIRAHQIVLKAADLCNKCMSVTNCVFVFGVVYLSVITVYAVTVDNAPFERILDVFVTLFTILRWGYMSDMIGEASSDIASAMYESQWLEAMFSGKVVVSTFRHAMLMTTLQAQAKPMHMRAGFMGALGNEFSLKFCRALYSYFEALQNLI